MTPSITGRAEPGLVPFIAVGAAIPFGGDEDVISAFTNPLTRPQIVKSPKQAIKDRQNLRKQAKLAMLLSLGSLY